MSFFTSNIDTWKDRLFANCRPIYIAFSKVPFILLFAQGLETLSRKRKNKKQFRHKKYYSKNDQVLS